MEALVGYFYLGLEAKVADNKYQCLEAAVSDAQYCANKNLMPIKIHYMDGSNQSTLIEIINPAGKREKYVVMPD
jgi:hypothetical protein